MPTFVRHIIVVATLLAVTIPAFSQNLIVFDVRKNLPMSNDEPVYRDFYINGGSLAGLQVGMVVEVVRRSALYDAYQNKSPGDLVVAVGQLKIIHVQDQMSVAREYETFSRANMPVLEHNYILVGDRLDLGTAVMENKLKKRKKNAAIKKLTPMPLGKTYAKDFASRAEDAPDPVNLESQP